MSDIEKFFENRQLALVGMSESKKKFGNAVFKELKKKGYEISIVHPRAKEIEGQACYPKLTDVPETIQSVVIVVPGDQTEIVVKEALQAGIKNIWMQQGSESEEAIQFCIDNNMNLIHHECILMFADPKGIHKFHHTLWKWFGKLPKH